MSKSHILSSLRSWGTKLVPIVVVGCLAPVAYAAEGGPAVTRVTAPCTDGEKWEFDEATRSAVGSDNLDELAASLADKEHPSRGFAGGMILHARKDAVAEGVAEYWMGRSLFMAKQYGPAATKLDLVVGRHPTSTLVPFQMAALACLRNIHASFPVNAFSPQTLDNLPSFFKAGVVPAEYKSVLWETGVELAMVRMKEKASKATVDKAVKLLSGSGYYSDYAAAIWAAERRHPEEAAEALQRLADAKDLPQSIQSRQNELKLMYARVLYQRGKHAEAARYLDAVDKRANIFPQALSQQAWVDLARGNYAKTIGASIALQSGGLRSTFAPEAQMTAAIALNELCLFPESLQMLTTFRKSYERSYFWLREHAGKQAPKAGERLYPSAIAFLNGQETSVPERIASEWIRSPIFLADQQAINASFAQEKAMPALIKGAAAFGVAEAAKLDTYRWDVAKLEAAEAAKETAKRAAEADATAKQAASVSEQSAKKLAEASKDSARKTATAQADAKKATQMPREAAKMAAAATASAKKAADAEATAKKAADAVVTAKTSAQKADEEAKAAEVKLQASAKEASDKDAIAKQATEAEAKAPAQKAQADAKRATDKARESAKLAERAEVAAKKAADAEAKAKALVQKTQEAAKLAADKAQESTKKISDAEQAVKVAEESAAKAKTAADAAKAGAKQASNASKARAKKAAQADRATKQAASKAIASAKKADTTADADAKRAASAEETGKKLKAEAEESAKLAETAKAAAKEASDAERTAKLAVSTAKANLKKVMLAEKSTQLAKSKAEAAAKKAAEAVDASVKRAAEASQANLKLAEEAKAASKLADEAKEKVKLAMDSAQQAAKAAADARAAAKVASVAREKTKVATEKARSTAKRAASIADASAKTATQKAEMAAKLAEASKAAAKVAEEFKEKVRVAAETAKASAQIAAEAKAAVKVASDAHAVDKKAADEAKGKAFAIGKTAKEWARIAAEFSSEGAKQADGSRKALLAKVLKKTAGKMIVENPSPALSKAVAALENAEARQKQLTKALAAWTDTLNQYKKASVKSRDKLMARIETVFRGLNDRMYRQLGEIAENNDLVEAEIWNGASQDMVWQNAHPEYAELVKSGKLKTDRRPASAGDVYDWGSSRGSEGKQEIWEDELGNVMANLEDNCSNKEKYMKLKRGER